MNGSQAFPSATAAVELLAPAGSVEALRAAIAGGADAVYLGLDRLNARRSAENFTLETLAEACTYAHLRGVRVYLTMNVLILPSEIEGAMETIADAWVAGIDAVIVQDLGLLRVVREALPAVRIHASTQLNTHSSDSALVLARRSVSRVTLARETSIPQIAAISKAAAAVGAEVESFVHGAICVCYSGQCLLSSLIGGRSANRGTCAQPCRLTYELVDEKNKVQAAPGAHLLSPKDLAGISVLDRLVESGVAALKIEGRMKSAEYVALVTGVYRKALDRARAQSGEYHVRDGELQTLNEAFSRGFSAAYLVGERGNEMMSYTRPNNRGVAIGRIARVEGSRAVLAADTAIDANDTIEVWTSRGRFAQTLGKILVDGKPARVAPAGSRIEFTLEGAAHTGDRVFRVRNAALSDAAARTFAESSTVASVPVDIHVRVVVGEPLQVSITDDKGRSGTATGPVVEAARTKAVTTADIIEHVGRLGGSPVVARNWDVDVSANAGIGFSVLHKVRRDAVEAWEGQVLAPWRERATTRAQKEEVSVAHLPRPWKNTQPAPRIVAAVSTIATAKACLQAGCESVHVPVDVLDQLEADVKIPHGVVPSLPRVAHDAQLERVVSVASGYDRVQAATLGLLDRFAQGGIETEAHWALNAMNAHAVAELADLGAGFVWLSPELSSRQVEQVCAQSPVPVGISVSGRQELMVTEHCILMAKGPCSQRCETCPRRQGWHFLRDRKGYSFPVRTDSSGRSHIYNSVPLDLSHALPEVLSTGVAAIRLDLETETTNRAAAEVARIRQTLQDVLAGREVPRGDRERVTSGHFFKGVSE